MPPKSKDKMMGILASRETTGKKEYKRVFNESQGARVELAGRGAEERTNRMAQPDFNMKEYERLLRTGQQHLYPMNSLFNKHVLQRPYYFIPDNELVFNNN